MSRHEYEDPDQYRDEIANGDRDEFGRMICQICGSSDGCIQAIHRNKAVVDQLTPIKVTMKCPVCQSTGDYCIEHPFVIAVKK